MISSFLGGMLTPLPPLVDSIAVSVFADIFIELTNTVSDGKIQITILILRRGALSSAEP